ncbi:hypothetical protein [Pseudemcibacter aquimaris]|uniref:hypothetical protein n=1 Tax=Pseudemcibacter aquimaris TaxID=2857064 RepID=UPI002011D3E6|nr:hypothetical protein [Pseudemcibacter aquimaris]MCC3860567.1 hypothetical protein [Pseudemcibacter aquimaris]WDU59390.1 hypothetical protein KW060_03825 [Pseudemcibacter aquimaris]
MNFKTNRKKPVFGRKKVSKKNIPSNTMFSKDERLSIMKKELKKDFVSFDDAKVRHKELLEKINLQIRERGCVGINWVPLCKTACEKGEISSFLLEELGLDPFLKWNSLYFAKDEKTAFIFDTVLYEPRLEGLYNDQILVLIKNARDGWEKAKEQYLMTGNLRELKTYRDVLKIQFANISADVDKIIYANKQNHIQHFFSIK